MTPHAFWIIVLATYAVFVAAVFITSWTDKEFIYALKRYSPKWWWAGYITLIVCWLPCCAIAMWKEWK